MATRIEVTIGVEKKGSKGEAQYTWHTTDRKITGGFEAALAEIPRIMREVKERIRPGEMLAIEQVSFTRNVVKGGDYD